MLGTFYHLFFKNVCCESFHKTANLQEFVWIAVQQVIKIANMENFQQTPSWTTHVSDMSGSFCLMSVLLNNNHTTYIDMWEHYIQYQSSEFSVLPTSTLNVLIFHLFISSSFNFVFKLRHFGLSFVNILLI